MQGLKVVGFRNCFLMRSDWIYSTNFIVVLIASLAQRYYAAKHDIRLGHLSPIPDPSIALFSIGILPKSMLIWPFGVLLIPSLPRMDARPWNDREILVGMLLLFHLL